MPFPIPVPYAVPPTVDPAAELRGLTSSWVGWDGSEWLLTELESGVQFGSGVRGLGMPVVDYFTQESAGVDGAFDRGFRTKPREVFWPLHVFADGDSQAWYDYDRAFWRTLQPGRTGVWEVAQPNGTARRLRLRIDDDGSPDFERDPGPVGWQAYGVKLVANQPYWEGDPLAVEFRNTAPVSFFDAGRVLSSSYTLGAATITNAGDVDVWPVWEIVGPSTTAAVGVGGNIIEVPFALTGSDRLVIDTHPTRQTALRNGVDVTGLLGAADFRPIPAGSDIPLSLTMTGAGMVRATITPLFWRAW